MNCKKCEGEFPDHLINKFISNEGAISVCPICALELTNQAHGIKRKNFNKGSKAQQLLDEARKIKEKKHEDN